MSTSIIILLFVAFLIVNKIEQGQKERRAAEYRKANPRKTSDMAHMLVPPAELREWEDALK